MKLTLIVVCASALDLGLALSPLRAQDAGAAAAELSRAQAVQEALARNPAIIAAREQVTEAQAGITVATAWADPALVTEADQLSSFLKPGSASEHDVGLQFTVPYPGRTRLNKKIARGSWQQAQYALTQLQQQTAAQTVQAYCAILVAARHHDDLLQSQAMSRQFLEKTAARFQAGTVAKLDLIKAKVDLSKTGNDLIANEHAIVVARATLNKFLGRSGHTPLVLTDSLEVPGELPDLKSLEHLAVSSRPELLSQAVQEEAARDSTSLARQYWKPDLNLTLWRSYISGAPNSYKFDGGISLPLLFWQHEKGAITQARHHERELQATGADLLGQVQLDLQNAYSAAVTARQQAVYLRDELLPEARAAYAAAFTSYSLGGSSALELLDAKGTLNDAESQYTDALGAVNAALADLERAVGAALPSNPSGTTHEK